MGWWLSSGLAFTLLDVFWEAVHQVAASHPRIVAAAVVVAVLHVAVVVIAVLVAVVREFANKADKALAANDARVAVIELEQAGDSAKAAVEADAAVAQETTSAVLDAHLAICLLKAGPDQG